MRTGKIKVGIRNLDGHVLPVSEREKELVRKGYTIERTPNGKIIHSPIKK